MIQKAIIIFSLIVSYLYAGAQDTLAAITTDTSIMDMREPLLTTSRDTLSSPLGTLLRPVDTLINNPDTIKEYRSYYSFAYFEDSLFYTPVITFLHDTSNIKERLEEQWNAFVRDTLLLDWFLPVTEGPYNDSTNAQTDLQNLIRQMPDSVLIYEFPPIIFMEGKYKYKDEKNKKEKKIKKSDLGKNEKEDAKETAEQEVITKPDDALIEQEGE